MKNVASSSLGDSIESWEDSDYTARANIELDKQLRQQGEFVCELPHLEYVRVHGADATEFLHAQVTNDIRQLTATNFQLGGYCTPKGRLLCVFRVHRDGEDLIVQAHREVLPTTVEHLRRFVLRAKVELTIDDDLTSFAVVGEKSADVLKQLIGRLPLRRGDCLIDGGCAVLAHSLVPPSRYQVVGPASALAPLWQTLAGGCERSGSWTWASLDIQQGLPTVFNATSEQFVPQTLNMDITGAVSFEKGCYPGQEIVARMHYLGKIKSRMVLANVRQAGRPLPGDKLYAADEEQSTGMIVDAVPGESGYDVLATVRLEDLAQNKLRLGGNGGGEVLLKDLPYALDKPETPRTK